MTRDIRDFADILRPLTPEAFFADYHDKKPLHVPGGADKFAAVMSWPLLNDLLNMTSIWSGVSLQLALDKETIPPAQYCRPGIDRNGARVMQPDPSKVTALLRRGASLVANDVDTLAPGLASAADAFEAALGAKAQANIYCSWRQRQGFDSHFDTHDVYAVHVEGEKVWRVYEGRAEAPIAHPRFKSYGQAYHDEAKGKVLMEVTLRPGDLLYLPRGQYHDALASSAATLHVAFGLTAVIGVDFVDLVRDMAIDDPLFRANVPTAHAGEEPFETHVRSLARRLGELAGSPVALAGLKRLRQENRYARGGFHLPEDAARAEFRVRARGLKVLKSGETWHLADSSRRAVPIPPGEDELVAWVIARKRFTGEEIAAAFPDKAPEERSRLLDDLAAMKVIEPT